MFLFRTTKVATLSSVENDVNLYSKAGSPNHPINYIVFNTANKGASSTSTPAMRTGSFKGGSLIFISNSATISGASGTAGANGVGGNGGRGQDAGNPYVASAAGSSGGTGGTGTAGGHALVIDGNSTVKNILYNTGTIIRGAGGPGGTGGGGGGGGGNSYVYP